MIIHDRLNTMLDQYDRIGRIVYHNPLSVLVERLPVSNAELDLLPRLLPPGPVSASRPGTPPGGYQ